MCSILVIVSQVQPEDPFQMSLVEHDHLPKTLASEGGFEGKTPLCMLSLGTGCVGRGETWVYRVMWGR